MCILEYHAPIFGSGFVSWVDELSHKFGYNSPDGFAMAFTHKQAGQIIREFNGYDLRMIPINVEKSEFEAEHRERLARAGLSADVLE